MRYEKPKPTSSNTSVNWMKHDCFVHKFSFSSMNDAVDFIRQPDSVFTLKHIAIKVSHI